MGLFGTKNIPFTTETERVKFTLIWQLSWIAAIVLLSLFLVFYFDDSNAKYSYFIGFLLAICGVLYLRLTKKHQAVYIFYAAGATILMQFDTNLTLDTPHLANYFWVMLVIILTVFGTSLKIALLFLIVNVLGIVYYSIFTMSKHYQIMHEIETVNSIAVGLELICIISVISYIIFLFVKTRNLAEVKLLKANSILEQNNIEISRRDEEKTILVKEIHHRVKNNLQIIISLLRLQMMDIKNSEAKIHFSEAINRVMVMSSIHQKLYQENNLTDFNLSEYIQELATELKLFFIEEEPINIKVDVKFKKIDLKTIVPVGLLLNELLSNSFKYAFQNKAAGKIDISVHEENDLFVLNYSDNGTWKEVNETDNSFGLELLDILTEQLNGTKELKINENGTFYTFQLQAVLDKT